MSSTNDTAESRVAPIAVSIVVPTYRRDDLLRQCLAALEKQRFDAGRYEILIADDSGQPTTRSVVENFRRRCRAPMRYVAVGPTHGPAAARNAGWRAARGRVIAFTDDDCQPQPDWLREGLQTLDSTGAEAASGRVVVPLPRCPTDYEKNFAGLESAEFVTANCFCVRQALESIGGFDERFTRAWREDSDLQFALLERGFRIVRADSAIVVHPLRPGSWGISLRQQNRSFFDALLYKKHRRLFRERIAPLPWSYYAIGAAIVGIAAGTAAGIEPLAGLSALCWVVLTGRFLMRRLSGTSRSISHITEMICTSVLIPPLSLYWNLRGAWRFRVFYG
jgi:glycosyltransferase involved in cell wall biosynthesis